ncbi:zinc finger protein 260-like [Eurosta solidaginis]|uniref:zinc finger protein 260-like n=1 Tax=Eurosta solidaginis TaxID=178769 RepID=UPI003530CACB
MQCRGCMQIVHNVTEMSSIISRGGKTFFDYFNECTQLNASKIDTLPQVLCLKCSKYLKIAYNFRIKAVRCDKKLKQLSLQKIEPVPIDSSTEQYVVEKLEEYKVDPLLIYESIEKNETGKTNMARSEEDLFSMMEGDVKTEISVEILNTSEASEDGSTCPPILSCDICNMECRTLNILEDHINEFHTDDVTCTKCSSVFEIPMELYLHDKFVHSISGSTIRCPWCKRSSLILKNELVDHLKAKHFRYYLKYFHIYSSDNVDNNVKNCQNPISLDNELIKDDKDQKYDCPMCFKSFVKHKSYDTHIKNTHKEITTTDMVEAVLLTRGENSDPDVEKNFECLICPKQFQSKISLAKHITIKHEAYPKNNNNKSKAQKSKDNETLKPKEKYLCSFCPQEFVSEPGVIIHEKKIHLHQRPDRKECPICHKKIDPKHFMGHMRDVHPSERKFVCDICGCSYKTKTYLRDHKALHLDRKFKCTLCDKNFARTNDLKWHMRFHTGEAPYACDICDKRYKVKGHLNDHLQKHAGIKHKCKECGKEFNILSQLRIHSYKHTGMPYKCTVCSYACPKRDVFRKHMLRIHDMIITPEELCAMFRANTGRVTYVGNLEIATGGGANDTLLDTKK